MYLYRTLTDEQKREVLAYRRLMQLPLHEPPHIERESNLYFITAANFEHKHILTSEARRVAFTQRLLSGICEYCQAEVFAWVVLPNHYHLLERVDLKLFRGWIDKLHNATSSTWNREDQQSGRQVWYRFTDRGIRNDRHFWAAMNYIHINPVKHGYTRYVDEWRCSSIHAYIAEHGYEAVERLHAQYPPYDFGKKWDR